MRAGGNKGNKSVSGSYRHTIKSGKSMIGGKSQSRTPATLNKRSGGKK